MDLKCQKSQHDILQTIRHLRTRKASGPDQIPNEVLKVIACEICSCFEQIFNNPLALGHYPSHFKESIMVILRKIGGNRDYTSPKSYRPISLLNTLGKIIEAILATRISYMATIYNLLPKTHFGGQRGSCIETAIHNLLEKVYAAWNKNEIASLLMMDVSAAYPNTSHQRLLHNLRKRKIDYKVVQWVASFLTNRHTIVKTNEHTTPKLSIDLGLPQGSPLSSILYLFYNADSLDENAKKGVEAQGFIDDITLIVTGKSTKGNNQKLAKVHNSVCKDWRAKHGSEFSIPKYQLIHMSRKRDIDYTAGVRLREGHGVQGTTTAINLGITLQLKLGWEDHISKIKSKAIKSLGALSSIAGSTWGGNLLALRRIFKAVIIPQITYGASIWHMPSGEKGHRKTLVTQLAQVQALGARAINGALKATSVQTLNIEAYLTPIGLELDKKADQTAARLYSGPLYSTITQNRSVHPR